MSFYEIIERYRDFDFDDFFAQTTAADVEHVLTKERLGDMDLLTL
jgi:2-iminoacetate synthase